MTVNELEPRIDLLPPPDGQVGFVDIGALELESGAVLPSVSLAVQRWGELSPNRDKRRTRRARTDRRLTRHRTDLRESALPRLVERDGRPRRNRSTPANGASSQPMSSVVVAARPVPVRRPTTASRGAAGSRRSPSGIRIAAEKKLVDLLGIDPVGLGSRRIHGGHAHPRMGSYLPGQHSLRAGSRNRFTGPLQIRSAPRRRRSLPSSPIRIGRAVTTTERGGHLAPDSASRGRRIAHLTYRTEAELDARFENSAQNDENPWNGWTIRRTELPGTSGPDKLVDRFDPSTYVLLTEAMNRHDIGRGRGGCCGGVGIDHGNRSWWAASTRYRLYPLRLQEEIADGISTCSGLEILKSKDGHDGFLTEADDRRRTASPNDGVRAYGSLIRHRATFSGFVNVGKTTADLRVFPTFSLANVSRRG